jgi:hypothetical protein
MTMPRSTLARVLTWSVGLAIAPVALVGLSMCPVGAATHRSGVLVIRITSQIGGGGGLRSDPKPGMVLIRLRPEIRSLASRPPLVLSVAAGRRRTVSLPPGTYEVSVNHITGWPTAQCNSVTVGVKPDRTTNAKPHCQLAPALG